MVMMEMFFQAGKMLNHKIRAINKVIITKRREIIKKGVSLTIDFLLLPPWLIWVI